MLEGKTREHTEGEPLWVFKIAFDYFVLHHTFVIIIKRERPGKQAVEYNTK